MAEKDVSKPAEPPKPVHIGGESFLDRILPYTRQIIIGCAAVVGVIIVVVIVNWIRESRQRSATEKLETVLAVAREPVRGKSDDPKSPGFADVKARGVAVLDAMAKHDTNAAGHAFRGGQLLDAGKIDDAIAEYRKGIADRTIEGVLSREGLGLALEAKAAAEKDATARQKGYEEALAAFTAMQPDEKGPRHAYALYHQARLQQLIGKRAEAKALFIKAKEAAKDDQQFNALVDKRLAALGGA